MRLAGATVEAYTRDLSVGGMFLVTDDPLPAGSLAPTALDLPDGTLELTAIVVHAVEGIGMGLRFEASTDEKRYRLESFLAAI